jgi:hypothetical protein
MLRHADIAITAQHYLDTKERVTLGMGNLLAMPSNVKPMPQPDAIVVAKRRVARQANLTARTKI